MWVAAACSGETAVPDSVSVRYRADLPLVAAEVQFAPPSAVESARIGSSGWLAVERHLRSRPITVRAPGFCPLVIPAGPQRAELQLTPLIDLGGERSPLGFDAPFAIRVKHGCPSTGRGRISWRQVAGPALRELATRDDGFQLSARTASLAELHPEALPAGIVPFSPRTQGRVVLEARWQRGSEPPLVRTLSLTATSRASGLSSVAVSQQVVLGGGPYRVVNAPPRGHATVLARGEYSLFTPDAPGRWQLERADNTTLSLQALWHDRTPFDCGRSECHAQIANTTETSPMSHALERQLPATDAVSCMLDCHVTGERGLRDGGFLAMASELGFSWLERTRWQDLPQTLRRLGGVRCTACHGPGAIPPPEGRAQILSSDVCATCHDAPPQYPQVNAWRSSRMARADQDPATRAGACAECHTTGGFLEALGARGAHASQLTEAVTGIACAACHAPHATHRGPRLLRSADGAWSSASAAQAKPLVGDAVGESDRASDSAYRSLLSAAARVDGASALCLRCHAPQRDALQPTAAAGPLLFGVARVPVESGEGWELLRGKAPHATVARGCIGCHGADPAAPGKLDHTFRANAAVCKSCHASEPSETQAELRERAQQLLRQLAPACDAPSRSVRAEPAHAHEAPPCDTARQTRARYIATLILEDRAAAVHNADFARALLSEAERQLTAAER